jgi:hypothetical protein
VHKRLRHTYGRNVGWVRSTYHVYILSGKNTAIDNGNVYVHKTASLGECLLRLKS